MYSFWKMQKSQVWEKGLEEGNNKESRCRINTIKKTIRKTYTGFRDEDC